VSVSLRLFATIALIFLLSSAGGALIGYFDARQRIAAELDSAMIVGQASADRAVAALARSFRPAGHLTEFVSLFDGDRHLQASLLGPSGQIISKSTLLPAERAVPRWFIGLLEPRPHVMDFALPGELASYGKLRLETVARNEIDEIWSTALLAFLTLLLFMGLVLSLVALVVWHALRPVKALLAAFEDFGTDKDSGDLKPFGPPEFRRLFAGFNAMAQRLKTTEQRNKMLGAQIATVQEEERAELARDLHDEIGPLLFSIDVDAAAIRGMATAKGDPKRKEVLDRAKAISAGAVKAKQHVRAILARLRPNLAADIGLEQALIELVASEQRRHPAVRFEERLESDCHDAVASAALYAVAREAIHNALKHAQPRHVRLSLLQTEPQRIELAVSNDGGQLKPPSGDSHGLRNMRERVEALGGAFSIEENPTGVMVRAVLPSTGMPAQERLS
jgi:two-component system sensor histidine kinase UhpB